MKILSNEKGVALITVYIFLTVFITLTAGFSLSAINELSSARRHKDSTKAFWLAEAAINQFMHDTTMLNSAPNGETDLTIGGYSVHLAKNDTDPQKRLVTSTALINGYQRQIQIQFDALPPDAFNNTLSTGGNITLTGTNAILKVHQKTRLTGTFSKSGSNLFETFDDKVEGVAAGQTTLTIPDQNASLDPDLVARGTGTTTPDEFIDFVQFYRDVAASYPAEQVAYFQGDGTLTITPNTSFLGKKIIFVEGATPGAGDVNILFTASWASDQNLTIISTGSINYTQPLQSPASNSRLNVVAWSDYYEPAALLSSRKGVTYSHGYAYIRDVLDISRTEGSLIANGYINIRETIAWKEFFYDSSILTNMPPGFQGLIGQGSAGYQTTYSDWKEI